jgi:hypothetical protein
MNWYKIAQNITLFHGSNYRGDNLNINSSETGDALFLTDDVFAAEEYGRYIYEISVNLNNPFMLDAQGESWITVPQKDIINNAKNAGHDAVIFKNISDNKYTSSIASTVYAILDIGTVNISNIIDTQENEEWYLE